MLVITNWWGIFFSFGIPAIFWGIGMFYIGIEEGQKRAKILHSKHNKQRMKRYGRKENVCKNLK